jgi:hypothetical protein
MERFEFAAWNLTGLGRDLRPGSQNPSKTRKTRMEKKYNAPVFVRYILGHRQNDWQAGDAVLRFSKRRFPKPDGSIGFSLNTVSNSTQRLSKIGCLPEN